MKESQMSDIAEFIMRVCMDKVYVKDEVSEFMNDYTKVHYAFEESEAYKYIQF